MIGEGWIRNRPATNYQGSAVMKMNGWPLVKWVPGVVRRSLARRICYYDPNGHSSGGQ